MDLRQLSYVVAIVDHGGFTKAAAALHVAQPSMSQAVRALERELGVELFDRVGRTVRLTAAGRALLPGARQALRDADVAREAVAAVRGVRGGRIDLVALPTLAVDPVARFVGEFALSHPDVTVRLVEPDEPGAVAASVASGVAELGVTELPVAAVDDGTLVAVELPGQRYAAVVHHATKLGETVALGDLAALPLVTTVAGTSTRRLVDDAFTRAGCTPRIAVESELREVIAPIVEAGGGYTILPEPAVERIVGRSGGVVRSARIEPPIFRRLGVVRRRGPLSPAGRAFLDVVERSRPSD